MQDLLIAARAIVHQRDHFAEHGAYDQTTYRPDEDQSFDDWAADILDAALRQWDGEDEDQDDGKDNSIIGYAVFQGEAWVNDHAVPVDDARHRFPVTVSEYDYANKMRPVQDLDTLQEAKGAPRAVKDWPGPFTIRMDWGDRKPAAAAYLENPHDPSFDADELTRCRAFYSDAEWATFDAAQIAVLLDINERAR